MVKSAVNKGNIDNAEEMCILAPYAKCFIDEFKECEKTVTDLKMTLKDQLLKEITIRYVDEVDQTETEFDSITNGLVYDLCGYLVKTRCGALNCDECTQSLKCDELDLPEDFSPADHTALRNRGGLIFVTIPMYQTFRAVERVVSAHFDNENHIYMHDSYQECISKLCKLNLRPICCDTHRDDWLPYLIMQYVQIRYYFESKRQRNSKVAKSTADVHQNFKLAKLG